MLIGISSLTKRKYSKLIRLMGLTLVFSLILSFALLPASAATQQITFGNNGVKYIYSNQPENIYEYWGEYTIEQTLSSSYTYDIEYNHVNMAHTNYDPSLPISRKIGVALYNNNSSTATITVYALVKGYQIFDSSHAVVDLTAPLASSYQQGVGATTITIPAYGSTFLMYSNVPHDNVVFGKAKIKSNLSNVRLRIFQGNTTDSASSVFSYSRDTKVNDDQTTGYFNYDGKYNTNTIDASTNPTFYLSDWLDNNGIHDNINEYETGTNILGRSKLGGNYGMTYTITINNPASKKLRITPYAYPARLVVYNPYYGYWYDTGKITSGYWTMPMTSTSTYTFKYVLPGFNDGNMKFEVVP